MGDESRIAYSDIELEGINPVKTGKVRSIYDLGDSFLFVATDRVSAYDCILPTPILDKGKVLTQVSKFWFDFIKDIVDVHILTAEFDDFPDSLKKHEKQLKDRSMIVKKAKVIPVECVVRGYISGSAWVEYVKKGTVNEVFMPEGLKESEKLITPIFTPATKADSGHDENIHFDKMCGIIGKDLSEKLQDLSISIYSKARDYMEDKGIILADTKFEFGLIDDKIILIDEVLTPDSSRFWPKDLYEIGRSQESYDKQFVRDYLNKINWDRKPPAPVLPEEIVNSTRQKYLDIYEIITGSTL